MGLSIQEQLLKAGLVDKKQLKKADHEKRVRNKKKRKAGYVCEDRDQLRLQQQQLERTRQDQKLNAERNQQAQRRADQAATQQLIASDHLPVDEGGRVYHYVDAAGKVKRILVSQEIVDKLADGRLGLATHNRELVLVSAETAIKVLQRDKDSILAYNDPTSTEDEYPPEW